MAEPKREQPRAKNPGKGTGRKILIAFLALVLAVLILAPIAGWITAQNPRFRAWLLTEVNRELLAATGSRLEVDGIGGNLLTSLSLENPRLVEEEGPWFTAKSLRLTYNPVALTGGAVKLGKLELDKPHVKLPVHLDRWTALGGGSGGPLALTLGRVRITDGSLEPGQVLDPLQGIEGFNLDGGLKADITGIKAEAEFSLGSLRVENILAPVAFTGRLALVKNVIQVDGLEIITNGQRINLWGKVKPGDGDPTVDLQVESRDLDVNRLPFENLADLLPVPPVTLSAHATGAWDNPNVTGIIERGKGTLHLRGRLHIVEGGFEGEGELENVSPTEWWAPFPEARINGKGRAQSRGWPGVDGAVMRFEGDFGPSTILGAPVKSIKASGEMRDLNMEITSMEAKADWGSFQGGGYFQFEEAERGAVRTSISFKDFTPPKEWAFVPPILRQARLNGTAALEGGPFRPLASLEMGPSTLTPDFGLEKLSARGWVGLDNQGLVSLSLKNPGLEASLSGNLDRKAMDLAYDLKVQELEEVLKALAGPGWIPPELGVGGGLEARGTISGPWSGPAFSVNAEGRDMRYENNRAREALFKGQAAKLWPLPDFQARLVLNGFSHGDRDLGRLSALADLSPSDGDLQVTLESDTLWGHMGLKTKSSPYDLPLTAQMSGLSVGLKGGTPWRQEGPAGFILRPDSFEFDELNITQDGKRFYVDGGWDSQGNVKADLRASGLPLDLFISQPGLPKKASLACKFTLRGSLEEPKAGVAGEIDGIGWADMPDSRINFQGLYADDLLRVSGDVITEGKDIMDLEARVGLDLSIDPARAETAGREFWVHLVADQLPLAVIKPLAPGISDLSGLAKMDLTARGSLAEPHFSGRLRLDRGSFLVTSTAQAVRDLNLDLELDGSKVLVHRASIRSKGELTGRGTITLPGKSTGDGDLDLNITGRDFELGLGGLGEAAFGADLGITGPLNAPLIKGAIIPTRAFARLQLAPPEALKDVIVLQPGQDAPSPEEREAAREPSFLSPLALDLRVDLTSGLRLELDSGWLNLNGAVDLQKERDKPIIYGNRILISGGVIIIQGKRFTVEKGQVDFSGRPGPEPQISAQASINLGSAQAFVSVNGTPDKPNLQLTSNPPMSQQDILSTIIFGKPVRYLNQGQSTDFSAQALALLGQQGAVEMEKLFGKNLSPDVVTVYDSVSEGSSLEAGKYLSSDLYLRYRKNMGQEGGQNIGLEYRLSPMFSLESQVGTTRDSGVDFIFNYDFD